MDYLLESSKDFLVYLEDWLNSRKKASFKKIVPDPARAVVLSVDMIKGFCRTGSLASPRSAGVIGPVVRLFQHVWDGGVRDFILIQDAHPPDSLEFSSYPPHCIAGSEESETIEEIRRLPFYPQMATIPKNSVSSDLNTGLSQLLQAKPERDIFIVTGVCTDLCTYQLAMFLKLDANARQQKRHVIVPADCVATFDVPPLTGAVPDTLPHPGDLFHALFLYSLAANGVEIISELV